MADQVFNVPIKLPADPQDPLHAASKQYVDAVDGRVDDVSGAVQTLQETKLDIGGAGYDYLVSNPVYYNGTAGADCNTFVAGSRALVANQNANTPGSSNTFWYIETLNTYTGSTYLQRAYGYQDGSIWTRVFTAGAWTVWVQAAAGSGGSVDLSGYAQLTGAEFTGYVGVRRPEDFWNAADLALFGSVGFIGTNGSYALSLRSNGYRNASGAWTSLNQNGQTNGSGIDLLPDGTVTIRAGAPSGTDVPVIVTHTPTLSTFAGAVNVVGALTKNGSAVLVDNGQNVLDAYSLTDTCAFSLGSTAAGTVNAPPGSQYTTVLQLSRGSTRAGRLAITSYSETTPRAWISTKGTAGETGWAELWHSGTTRTLTNGTNLCTWDGGATITSGPGGGSVIITTTYANADLLELKDVNGSIKWQCNFDGKVVQNADLDVNGNITVGGTSYPSLSPTYYSMIVGDRPAADGLAGILFNPDSVANGMVLGFSKSGDCMRLWDFGTTGGPVRMQIDRLTGTATHYGEVVSVTDTGTPNAFRAVRGNYGVLIRNDGSDFWILLTASGDPYGSWNTLRPFNIDLATGLVALGNGLDVTGNVNADTVSCGYTSGVANSVSCSNWFRSNGNTGWYNATWAGGWFMQDATYVRSYQNKAVLASDFVISSDRRLKAGIRPLTFRGRLDPKMYVYRANGESDFGFIAQEVQYLYPEAVGTSVGDGMLQLSYSKLTAVLAAQVNMVEDMVLAHGERLDRLEIANRDYVKRINRNSRRIALLESDRRRHRAQLDKQSEEIAALRAVVMEMVSRKPWWRRLFRRRA